MKRPFLKLPVIVLLAFMQWLPVAATAQRMRTIAGQSKLGYSGDGGPATHATLNGPYGLAVDTFGNVFFADADNNCIRKIDKWGKITTVAGTGIAGYSGDSGSATTAQLKWPTYLALDLSGNILISDTRNYRVRKVNRSTGIITTIAGNGRVGSVFEGAAATASSVNYVSGIAVDDTGNIYIGDQTQSRIRKIDSKGRIYTYAGTGNGGYNGDGIAASEATISLPAGLTFSPAGELTFADRGNHRIRKISKEGMITTIAGSDSAGNNGDGGPAVQARLTSPHSVTFTANGDMYITDHTSHLIRKVSGGTISTFAGNGIGGYNGDDGIATATELFHPAGITTSREGTICFADLGNNRIRELSTLADTTYPEAPVQEGIHIYPNPARAHVTVFVRSRFTNTLDIVVSDATGRLIAQVRAATNLPVELPSDLPQGTHFIRASTVNGRWLAPLCIVK